MFRRKVIKLSQQCARYPNREFSVMSEAELRNFRQSINKWVSKEVIPNINKWEDAGMLPRYLYKQAAELGILAPGYPVEVMPFCEMHLSLKFLRSMEVLEICLVT
jgi:alkylation response protein AidB-like acyl-CoA dehydrogenase